MKSAVGQLQSGRMAAEQANWQKGTFKDLSSAEG
jgi:hypothetical protein